MLIFFMFASSLSPCFPRRLPIPEFLKPPNGILGSDLNLQKQLRFRYYLDNAVALNSSIFSSAAEVTTSNE